MNKRFLKEAMPKCIADWWSEQKAVTDLSTWEKAGKPIPPPHAVKRQAIREYQKRGGYSTLVETGTYYGDMIFAQLSHFKSIYSIELAPYFYGRAVKRFKKYKHVHLFFGDSSTMLSEALKTISAPALFWLDGHYSGGKTAMGNSACPIWAELNQIMAKPLPHTILIDDARCFVGAQGYPTIEELQRYFADKNISHSFEVKDDIIRVILNVEVR